MTMTLVQAWTAARRQLEAAGIDTPVIDARILLLAASGVPRLTLISEPHTPLTPQSAATFEDYVARRAAREPAAHIVGSKGFWTLDLKSDRRGLIPRPETEVIVDLVLKAFADDAPKHVLDLGIGSGTILLALLAERTSWGGVGVDISKDALDLAAENARLHGLSDRLRLRQGDWHHGLEERFDIVVSNPPYIPSAVIDTLEIEVAQHDPRLALDGGHDGLDAYRTLLAALPLLLKPDGLFAFEFGIGQGADLLAMARAIPGLTQVRVIKDLSNLDRVLLGSFVPSGD